MSYRITKVEVACFPSNEAVGSAVGAFGISVDELRGLIEEFQCTASRRPGVGYQQHIADELERHLTRRLRARGDLQTATTRYSPVLGERADLAIAGREGGRRLYFEIEFRPNVEKDLVKFQIGWNRERLAAAVLVLAVDRQAVNPQYTSMPEFAKFARVIGELRPVYPLLLVGISGDHIEP